MAGALAGLSGLSYGVTLPLTADQLYNARMAANYSKFVPAPGGGYVRVVSADAPLAGARVWSAAAGKIAATDAVVVAARAGPLAVAVAQRATVAQAAGAVARCLAGSVPVCAAVTAAGLLYSAYRVYRGEEHDAPACDGADLCYDPGTALIGVQQHCTSTTSAWQQYAHQGCGGSLPAAVDSWVAQENALGIAHQTNTSVRRASCNASSCTIERSSSGGPWGFYGTMSTTLTTVQVCPEVVDPLNPANNRAAGGAPGPDGKCATASAQHVPIEPDDAAGKVATNPPPDLSGLKDATRDAVDAGGQVIDGAEIESSGPASQQGPAEVSQTTDPQGTTTTTTTPTYHYDYQGDNISVSTTTVTQTCTGAGSCTTTTVNEAPPKEQDPKDPCTANPTRAGCAKLGEVAAAEVPRHNQPVEYSPVQFAGGVCPGAVQFAAFGVARELAFQPMCDAATQYARPVFLLIGAVIAGFVFVGGLKS